MKIETILEKGSARLNEDTLVAQGNMFGVFDGATSLNKTVFENGKTGEIRSHRSFSGPEKGVQP